MGRVLELWENLTGAVIPFAGATAPAGFVLCDGSLKDVADYPNLFAVIGNTYNTGGEAAGKFRVPDMRGRVVAGVDNMGGTAASRLTTAGSGVNGAARGAAGGGETHTLTTAQMPQHNHGVNDPGHIHSANARLGFSTTGGQFPYRSSADNDTYINNTGTATTGITIQNNGSGQAHPNVQPTLVLNYIIKT